jgi:hypothetical protein
MNCDGCKQLKDYSTYVDEIHLECRYTPFEVKSLENCPCKQCIIKIVCQERCQEFATEYNRCHDIRIARMYSQGEKK